MEEPKKKEKTTSLQDYVKASMTMDQYNNLHNTIGVSRRALTSAISRPMVYLKLHDALILCKILGITIEELCSIVKESAPASL